MNTGKQPGVAMRAGVFLALCFGFSWSGAFVGFSLLQQHRDLAAELSLQLMLAGPGLAGVLCALLFESGQRAEALGIGLRPNRWWLWAYGLAVLYSALALGANILIGGSAFVAPQSRLQFALSSLIVNPASGSVFATLAEELGWRGYLYRLWRRFGFWQYSLATGLIWGIWHLPGIILFKLNYPAHPWLGAAIFVPYCMLLAPLATLVRDKGRSVIAAGILHGTLNATDFSITTIEKAPSTWWQGDTGFGGLISLGLSLTFVVFIRRRQAENGDDPKGASAPLVAPNPQR